MTFKSTRGLHAFARAGAFAAALGLPAAALADPISILFVGNSYTFGRVDPVMSYNTANVRDLTAPTQPGFSNTTGSNAFEPHPWGGVPGIFQRLTSQAGLDYDVAISARNAATLRGQYLSTNPAGWNMLGNVASQQWDAVVLQEQSETPLPVGTTPNSRPGSFDTYATLFAAYARTPSADRTVTETQIFGSTAACQAATGASANTCNNTVRSISGNANSNPDTDVYLYETWARPNLIAGGFVTTTDDATGVVTRTTTPIPNPSYAAGNGLERMTADLQASTARLIANQVGVFDGVAPVGEAFLRAVQGGFATRNMYAPDASTDGLLDLWFDDGTHASKWGSYLSGLTLFGTITGRNPSLFGANELAARELGITAGEALVLQQMAASALGYPVPEPGTVSLLLLGIAGLVAVRRRDTRGERAVSPAV